MHANITLNLLIRAITNILIEQYIKSIPFLYKFPTREVVSV